MPTPFALNLAAVAAAEFAAYSGHHEADAVLSARIRQYWQDLGLEFPNVATAWSGVFVTWCVRRAGASTQEFPGSPRHAIYVNRAIRDAAVGQGLFHGVAFDAAPIAIGDILQWNRPGQSLDFAYAASHASYESHCAIVVELAQDQHGAQALTIGGNEHDSVGRTRVRLDGSGRVMQREAQPFMTLIRTQK